MTSSFFYFEQLFISTSSSRTTERIFLSFSRRGYIKLYHFMLKLPFNSRFREKNPLFALRPCVASCCGFQPAPTMSVEVGDVSVAVIPELGATSTASCLREGLSTAASMLVNESHRSHVRSAQVQSLMVDTSISSYLKGRKCC